MIIASIYMLVAGVNFALHFHALRQQSIRHYFSDSESQFYINVILVAALIVSAYLVLSGTYSMGEGVLQGLFQTISIATTAGFSTANFSIWPSFLPILLILLSFMLVTVWQLTCTLRLRDAPKC